MKYTKLIRHGKNFSTNRTFLSLKTKARGMHAAGFRWYGCSGGCRVKAYFSLRAAWAAARRAMGTRNGEQLT